jgi:MEMO1 family protein
MAIVASYIVPHPPIILHEIGRGREGEIQDTINAYKTVAAQIARLKPDTIIVSSPHTVSYADYFHISPGRFAYGDLSRFGSSKTKVDVEYDREFVEELVEAARRNRINAGTKGETDKSLDHGSLIPLSFIQEVYKDFKIVKIGLSGRSLLSHYELGKCVAQTAQKLNRNTVFIASGDLSHKLKDDGPYGFDASGPLFDEQITSAMKTADFLSLLETDPDMSDAAGECGLRSFIIMAGAMDGKAVKTEFMTYQDNFGVGYAVSGYTITDSDENRKFDILYKKQLEEKRKNTKQNEDEYVRLARVSLENYIKTKIRITAPSGLPNEMLKHKSGVFVSIKKCGQLRGCIGTIAPVFDCIANEILHNAISAGTEDPRFPMVTIDELDDLVYSVDVLAPAEAINSINELDVKRYGVIVTRGYKRGLLLPNLEGVDTPEQQVSIALNKAGINESDSYSMERFEVVRHK